MEGFFRSLSKAALGFIFFLSAQIGEMSEACPHDAALSERGDLIAALGLPENSLLEIRPTGFAVYVDELNSRWNNAEGQNNLEVYRLLGNDFVLSELTQFTVGTAIRELSTLLPAHENSFLLLSKSDIYFFGDFLAPYGLSECIRALGEFVKSAGDAYEIFRPNSEPEFIILQKQGILKSLMAEEDPDYLQTVAPLTTQSYDILGGGGIAKEIAKISPDTYGFQDVFVINHQRHFLKMSRLTIPKFAFDQAVYFKDANDLFYVSEFDVNDDLTLVQEKPSFNLSAHRQGQNLSYGLEYNFSTSESFSYRFASTIDDRPEISAAFVTHRAVVSPNSLVSTRLGRLTKEVDALLMSSYTIDARDARITGLHGYLTSGRDCNNCVSWGGFGAYSKYFEAFDLGATASFGLSKDVDFTASLAFAFHKRFSNQSSIDVFTQVNPNQNDRLNLGMTLRFHLGDNNQTNPTAINYRFDAGNVANIFAITQPDRTSIFENTPAALRRNWKNYMTF